MSRPDTPRKGRGSFDNPDHRFSRLTRRAEDDGWGILDEAPPPLATELIADASRTIIAYNDSPDVPADRSINPYRGCEHGCIYCYARPSHAWLGLSPGLDFESRIFYKPDAAALLRHELAAPSYRPKPIGIGLNTDAYQPAERRLGVTRSVIEVLAECRHPFSLITKSALVERDLDLLTPLASPRLAELAITLPTLDRHLARRMEPRAASPQRRLETISQLSAAGHHVTVMVAPVIPMLNDHELEEVLERAREAGAADAAYILLRLPHEVADLFVRWIECHYPEKAARVMARVRDMRGGKEYESRFGERMRGRGIFADVIRQRFHVAYRRLGFAPGPPLDTTLFVPPKRDACGQLDLF